MAEDQPDGYTLMFTTSTPIVMVHFTLKKVPYDVQRDLTTVSHIGSTSLVLYVNASSPIQNLKQLGDAARAGRVRAGADTPRGGGPALRRGREDRAPSRHAGRLASFGIDATGTSPAQANEITKTDMAKWQAIIKEVSYISFE